MGLAGEGVGSSPGQTLQIGLCGPLPIPGVAYMTPHYLYYVETGGLRLSRTQKRIALVFWEAWSRMQGVSGGHS